MKSLLGLTVLVCAAVVASAQQPTPSPAPITRQRSWHAHRPLRRTTLTPVAAQAAIQSSSDFYVGEARVDVNKDETVVRLAMAQHGSVLIELPANDGPRYIIPGDPEMATVDEKALERNKRAIVVRPGTLFVPPPPNRKTRTPSATVTAQMRSGLVVTFLFYPVEDLAQNVHRCVLNYNRDEVVARRRAAGLPVNLDTTMTIESRGETGQSTASSSIAIEDTDGKKPADKSLDNKPTASVAESGVKEKTEVAIPSPSPTASVEVKPAEPNEQVRIAAIDALARAKQKPKQFKNWTKPVHALALSVLPTVGTKTETLILTLAVKNTGRESLKIAPGSPELLVEMQDDDGKPINLQSVKNLHLEISDPIAEIHPGKTIYYAIAFAPQILGSHQQLKITVAQTNAADAPASIAIANSEK
jgi:hypothetical protein